MNIKKFLTKKAGITLLEGLIAMGLLALIASGTFGVLLSVSRKTDQPDRREDMVYAVERVNDLLSANAYIVQGASEEAPTYLHGILCSATHAENKKPLQTGWHNVDCLLPPSCDAALSSFRYYVSNASVSLSSLPASQRESNKIVEGAGAANVSVPELKISYDIQCNGYSL